MSSNTRLYVDGMNDISLINGIVHITFANLSKPNKDQGEPVIEDTVRLALPIGGLIQSLQQMQNMIALMKERGVLTEAEPAVEEKVNES